MSRSYSLNLKNILNISVFVVAVWNILSHMWDIYEIHRQRLIVPFTVKILFDCRRVVIAAGNRQEDNIPGPCDLSSIVFILTVSPGTPLSVNNEIFRARGEGLLVWQPFWILGCILKRVTLTGVRVVLLLVSDGAMFMLITCNWQTHFCSCLFIRSQQFCHILRNF